VKSLSSTSGICSKTLGSSFTSSTTTSSSFLGSSGFGN